MQRTPVSILALAMALAIAAAAAHAGKPDHAGGKGKQKSHASHSDHDDDDNDDVEIRFSYGARDAWYGWYGATYGRGHCPPGLAKKRNGCMPPGLAKKRYTIGAPLPPGVVLVALPIDLSQRLGAPPRGYRYGIVDGDVVKLAVGTLLVVDALGGMLD